MLVLMPLTDTLESFVYPPCVIAGLMGGLVTRRWPVAVAIGFLLPPLLDYALSQATFDAEPHYTLVNSLTYAIIGALLAFVVWAVARAIRGAAARNKRSA